MMRDGAAAATEFQKLINYRGVVANNPVGALARLQLGRAYAMQGDTAKAKAAYQDFLTLWKDADPDIPILIAKAKAEYAKLRSVPSCQWTIAGDVMASSHFGGFGVNQACERNRTLLLGPHLVISCPRTDSSSMLRGVEVRLASGQGD